MTDSTHPERPDAGTLAEKIHGLAPSHIYAPGVELFQQGAIVEDVYFVAGGLIKLVHFDPDGRELIIGLRFPGGLVGSSALLAGEPSLATAITLTRCPLHRIPGEVFLELLRSDPSVSWDVHRIHAREAFDHLGHLARLGTLSSRHRLEYVLRQLILTVPNHSSQRDIRLLLPLKHWEIARLIAVTPEHLSRLLKQMQQDGVIRREKGWVIVSHPEKLTAA